MKELYRIVRHLWPYWFKRWVLQRFHHYFPNKHRWEWIDLAECGCCGYEGVWCNICGQQMIIGYNANSYTGLPEGESGDYAEYGD